LRTPAGSLTFSKNPDLMMVVIVFRFVLITKIAEPKGSFDFENFKSPATGGLYQNKRTAQPS